MSPLTWFLPGKRTYTMSILSAVVALLLQADYQGMIHLMPMLKLALSMALPMMLGSVPVFLRKGIESAMNESKKSNK